MNGNMTAAITRRRLLGTGCAAVAALTDPAFAQPRPAPPPHRRLPGWVMPEGQRRARPAVNSVDSFPRRNAGAIEDDVRVDGGLKRRPRWRYECGQPSIAPCAERQAVSAATHRAPWLDSSLRWKGSPYPNFENALDAAAVG